MGGCCLLSFLASWPPLAPWVVCFGKAEENNNNINKLTSGSNPIINYFPHGLGMGMWWVWHGGKVAGKGEGKGTIHTTLHPYDMYSNICMYVSSEYWYVLYCIVLYCTCYMSHTFYVWYHITRNSSKKNLGKGKQRPQYNIIELYAIS